MPPTSRIADLVAKGDVQALDSNGGVASFLFASIAVQL
jgi:hypothetical protein